MAVKDRPLYLEVGISAGIKRENSTRLLFNYLKHILLYCNFILDYLLQQYNEFIHKIKLFIQVAQTKKIRFENFVRVPLSVCCSVFTKKILDGF